MTFENLIFLTIGVAAGMLIELVLYLILTKGENNVT